MSDNLNFLRQTYCRPGTINAKPMPELFPLERAGEQGRILCAKTPKKALDLKEFDPRGLEQSYRDEATGAELPVFAIFNLEGDHRCAFEIAVGSVQTTANPASLHGHMPFRKTQSFVRKINEQTIIVEHVAAFVCATLGSIAAVIYIVLERIGKVASISPYVILGGMAMGALFAYMLVMTVLDLFLPRKKLVITAIFDGILPRETREKARAAKEQFDNLYLIVDQEGRWESTMLPDPAPRGLDPLLVGEVNGGGARRYFLIDQFDLTAAEQYLIDEFALRNTVELS